MAQILVAVLRNATHMPRRHVGLHSLVPQHITSFSCTRRLRFCRNIARYNSDGPDNSKAFQEIDHVQPKSVVQSRKSNETDLLQNINERLADEKLKEYWLPSQHKKEYEDLLMNKITSSITADEILDIYKQNSDVMNNMHMLRTLKALCNLVANGDAVCLRLHEEQSFQDLCRRILKVGRQMEVEDLVSLLGYWCRLEVPADSKHVQTVLQLLRHLINDMDLRTIIHVEFLLKKFPLTPLSHALLMAIPLLLENSLNKEPLSDVSLQQLSQILYLCVNGQVPSVRLVLTEIYKRGRFRLGRDAMMSFLWPLMEMYTQDGKQISLTKADLLTREKLLKENLEGVARKLHWFEITQIETTVGKMSQAYDNQDFCSYNESFLNAVSEYCIEQDVGFTRAAAIIRKMLTMNYVSGALVEYMVSHILQDSEEIVQMPYNVLPLITAITASPTCLSNHLEGLSNHLEALKILLNHKSLSFELERCIQMPSLILALDLLSVGYYHQSLLEIITSGDFINRYMQKWPKTNITSKQLLQLHQILTVLGKSSLRVPEEFLMEARMLKRDQRPSNPDLTARLHLILEEPDLVVSGVLTENDIYIDHLIVMDDEGNPVKVTERVPSQGNTRIENLDIPENSKRIAILYVKSIYRPSHLLRRDVRVDQQLLETLGFIVVPVKHSVINRLTADEKNLYIKNLIVSPGSV